MAQTIKPSKQRKTLFQAPDHIRYKQFAALLSPDLRKTYMVRNVPVRRGDTVRVMRGDRKGFEGKVSRVDRKNYRIYIEGLTREKVDGTTVFVPVHPSKVLITKLNLDDKWRRKILERRKKTKVKPAEPVEKVKKTEEKVEVGEKPLKEEAPVEKLPATVEEEKPKRKRTAKKKAVEKPEAEKLKARAGKQRLKEE